ncbi:MAG: hypothetical protein OXE86_20615 [Alphaproteobacteria bacterium]|nr:hypothetical protein [Alphaproteobacteria bacterium]
MTDVPTTSTPAHIAPEAVEGRLSPHDRERFAGAEPEALMDAARRTGTYAASARLPAGTAQFLPDTMLAGTRLGRADDRPVAGDAATERSGSGKEDPPAAADSEGSPRGVVVRNVTPQAGLSVRSCEDLADEDEEDERVDARGDEPEDDGGTPAPASRILGLPGRGAPPQPPADTQEQPRPADPVEGEAVAGGWTAEAPKPEEEIREEFADETTERLAAAIPDSAVAHLNTVLADLGGQPRATPQDADMKATDPVPAGPDADTAADLEVQSEAALREMLGMDADPVDPAAQAVTGDGGKVERSSAEAFAALDEVLDDENSDRTTTMPTGDDGHGGDGRESSGAEGADVDRIRALEARLAEETALRNAAEQRAQESEDLHRAKDSELLAMRRGTDGPAPPGNRGAQRDNRTPDPIPNPRDRVHRAPIRRRGRGLALLLGLVAIGAGLVGAAAVIDPRSWPVRQVIPGHLLEEAAVMLGHRPSTLAVGGASVEVVPAGDGGPGGGLADLPGALAGSPGQPDPLTADPLRPANGDVLPSAGLATPGVAKEGREADAALLSPVPPDLLPLTAETRISAPPTIPARPALPPAGAGSAALAGAAPPLSRPQPAQASDVPDAMAGIVDDLRIAEMIRTELEPLALAVERLEAALNARPNQEPVAGGGAAAIAALGERLEQDIAGLGEQIEDMETLIMRSCPAANTPARSDAPDPLDPRQIGRFQDRLATARAARETEPAGSGEVRGALPAAASPGTTAPALVGAKVERPQDWRPGRVYMAPAISFRLSSRTPPGIGSYQVGDWIPGYGAVLHVTRLPDGLLISTENGALYQVEAAASGHEQGDADGAPAAPAGSR